VSLGARLKRHQARRPEMPAAKTNLGCEFVLVVEDDDHVRASIADILVLDGHRVVTVENGERCSVE
jgi:aerobic-type carbon monoxide dehydrogenase small subunit (CoxS/CutS family)